ncbi:MAG: phosphatidylserine/phosphatidylglycerophosphate/cardiolipin synthase family protein [Myxococcota bacterium]
MLNAECLPQPELLQWLRDRSLEWRARIEQIDQARRFLYATTYYIEADTYGQTYVEALARAAQRNVDVRLLIDDFGQTLGNIPRLPAQQVGLTQALKKAAADGVHVMRYRPRGLLRRRLGHGHHIKVQVSDAGTALFGSSNITARSFELWNELSLLIRGPMVSVLLRDACDLFETATGVPCPSPTLPEVLTTTVDSIFDYWTHDPNIQEHNNLITEGLVRRMNAATESIAVTTFFYKPMPLLAQAMLRACKRGVRVEIFHSASQALKETRLPYVAAVPKLGDLLRAGGVVYENQIGEHAKSIMIDGAWAAIGSYNFEWASHDRVAEAMLVSTDASVLLQMQGMFEELRGDPNNIPLERLDTADRLLATLCVPIRRWL